MTISKVYPAGWSTGEKLTSAQMNLFDTKLITALDKTSAGDTLSGVVTLSGSARFVPTCVDGANANTTYYATTANYIRVTSSVTSSRDYTLSATGANTNDMITIWLDDTATQNIVVKDQGGSTLITLGPANPYSSFASFIYKGGWKTLARGTPATALTNRIINTYFNDGNPIDNLSLTNGWQNILTSPPSFSSVQSGDLIELDIVGYCTITGAAITNYAELQASFSAGSTSYASLISAASASDAKIPFCITSRYTASSTTNVTMDIRARVVNTVTVSAYVQSVRARHIRP